MKKAHNKYKREHSSQTCKKNYKAIELRMNLGIRIKRVLSESVYLKKVYEKSN